MKVLFDTSVLVAAIVEAYPPGTDDVSCLENAVTHYRYSKIVLLSCKG